MSLKWIAETLCMGTWTHVTNLLRPAPPIQEKCQKRGLTPLLTFNNLNIYQLKVDLENYKAVYKRQGNVLEMEGHLEDFLNSASGQWPEPEIPPLVQ